MKNQRRTHYQLVVLIICPLLYDGAISCRTDTRMNDPAPSVKKTSITSMIHGWQQKIGEETSLFLFFLFHHGISSLRQSFLQRGRFRFDSIHLYSITFQTFFSFLRRRKRKSAATKNKSGGELSTEVINRATRWSPNSRTAGNEVFCPWKMNWSWKTIRRRIISTEWQRTRRTIHFERRLFQRLCVERRYFHIQVND